jgi:large subunit ribosomal protein L17
MLRNLAASVILFEKVETTEAKAKEIKKLVDRTITIGKKKTLAARRELQGQFFDNNVVDKVFDVLVDRFADRNSGYTRLLRTGVRHGDGAARIMVTLIADEKAVAEPKKTKKAAQTDEHVGHDHDHSHDHAGHDHTHHAATEEVAEVEAKESDDAK